MRHDLVGDEVQVLDSIRDDRDQPDVFHRRLQKLRKAAGVRHIHLHDLRHGRASLLMASGTDIAAESKMLGHSSIAITADTYSPLLEGSGARPPTPLTRLSPAAHGTRVTNP
jgi:integrase